MKTERKSVAVQTVMIWEILRLLLPSSSSEFARAGSRKRHKMRNMMESRLSIFHSEPGYFTLWYKHEYIFVISSSSGERHGAAECVGVAVTEKQNPTYATVSDEPASHCKGIV